MVVGRRPGQQHGAGVRHVARQIEAEQARQEHAVVRMHVGQIGLCRRLCPDRRRLQTRHGSGRSEGKATASDVKRIQERSSWLSPFLQSNCFVKLIYPTSFTRSTCHAPTRPDRRGTGPLPERTHRRPSAGQRGPAGGRAGLPWPRSNRRRWRWPCAAALRPIAWAGRLPPATRARCVPWCRRCPCRPWRHSVSPRKAATARVTSAR